MSVPGYIYNEVKKAGFTKEASCALLANIQAESAFKSGNLQDTFNSSLGISDEEFVRRVDGGDKALFMTPGLGFGLAQWTYGPRKEWMWSWFKERGVSIADTAEQVRFLLWEMKTHFSGIWDLMISSHDLEKCVRQLLYVWENPEEKTNNMRIRYASAQSWLEQANKLETESEASEGKITKNDAVNKVLNLARSEIGYHEQGDNITKYASYLDSYAGFYNGPKDGFPWCDCFYDYLFVKSFGVDIGRQMICQPMNSAGAGCLYSAQYYKNAGRWATSPEPGDQIFFAYAPGEYSHTGIVETVSGGTVTTIEGNTSDQVARRSYPISSGTIAGYGRPRWELASESSGSSNQSSGSTEPSQPVSSILRKGSKGAKVKELQEMLLKLGYDLGRWGADGDFGSDTERAVRAFQKDAKIEVDGKVGAETMTALRNAIKKIESPKKASELTVGSFVRYKGGPVYLGPRINRSRTFGVGKAKITKIYGDMKAEHPYYIVRTDPKETKVFGWVGKDQIEVL